ncbi:MAG: hypothetical protein WC705_01220 [Candidatus Paceibacterota bacterium]|jgi:hypothetical protein
MTLSPFKKSILINISILTVSVIVLVVFLYLFNLNIVKTVGTINQLKLDKDLVSQSSSNLSLLIKDWEVARKYKNEVLSLVPSKDNLVAFSKDLQKVAQGKNVVLNFSFGSENNPGTSKDIGSINFNGTVEGQINDIIHFFETLEESYYSLKIGIMDFSKSFDSNSQRANFSGQVFFIN